MKEYTQEELETLNKKIYEYYIENFGKESIAQIAVKFKVRTRQVYDVLSRYKIRNTDKAKRIRLDDSTWITGTASIDGYKMEYLGMGLDMARVEKLLLECYQVFDKKKNKRK